MRTNRLLLALLLALSVAVATLSVRVIQLRREVTHAELYVQAGLANWRSTCKLLNHALLLYGSNKDVRPALNEVAIACLSRTDLSDPAISDLVVGDRVDPDPRNLMRRIDQAIQTGDYFIHVTQITSDFPKGYKN